MKFGFCVILLILCIGSVIAEDMNLSDSIVTVGDKQYANDIVMPNPDDVKGAMLYPEYNLTMEDVMQGKQVESSNVQLDVVSTISDIGSNTYNSAIDTVDNITDYLSGFFG